MSDKKLLALLPAAAIFILSSCSSIYGDQGIIHNRNTEYLKARTTRPLVIPPGLSSSTIESHYPIADREYSRAHEPVDLTPPELNQPRRYRETPPPPPPKPVVKKKERVVQTSANVSSKPKLPKTYYDAHTRSNNQTVAQTFGIPEQKAVQVPVEPAAAPTPQAQAAAPATTAQNTNNTALPSNTTTVAANTSGNSNPAKAIMPNSYYDRYTRSSFGQH